jgi:DNA-binding response OmpR family regulator
MSVARILLIDDSAADINLLRLALDSQEENYELEVLRTGEDALKFIREQTGESSDRDPCVILLDLHLPQFDGLAILQAIRASSELSHVHVVVLSGLASPAEQERIAMLGAFYVQKPFHLTEFLELGAKIMAVCRSSAVAA